MFKKGLLFLEHAVLAGPCNFNKKESLAEVLSCEFCEISKKTFYYRTPPVAASVCCRIKVAAVKIEKLLRS